MNIVSEKLTFRQYREKLEHSNLSVVAWYLRDKGTEDAIRVLKTWIDAQNITPDTISNYVIKKYDSVTVKPGHFRWHTNGDEDCHRYYYGKNEFTSVTINDIEFLLHYNLGDGEGVYINY